MFTAEVMSQTDVVGEAGSLPGKAPMPVGLVGHVEDVQQGRRADLARHGGAEHDHDHDHQHILTPAAKAAERRPAMKTKAIMSAAAMSVAATVDRSEPSVRRTMSPRLMSWICT